MFNGESKEKNIQFIKSLNKKRIKNKISLKDKEDANAAEEQEKEEENLDHLMQSSLYNKDLVLYSRVMIKKKKYFNLFKNKCFKNNYLIDN